MTEPRCPSCGAAIARQALGYCCDDFKRSLESMEVHEPRKLARRILRLEAKVDAMAAMIASLGRPPANATTTTRKRRTRRTGDSAA